MRTFSTVYAARYVGVHYQTISNNAKSKTLLPIVTMKGYLYEEKELAQYQILRERAKCECVERDIAWFFHVSDENVKFSLEKYNVWPIRIEDELRIYDAVQVCKLAIAAGWRKLRSNREERVMVAEEWIRQWNLDKEERIGNLPYITK